MLKSDYSYTKLKYKDADFIVIEDLNLGSISVTNDMESVLKEISDDLEAPLDSYEIIYKDSRGVFDGVSMVSGSVKFLPLGASDAESAMERSLKKKP